MDALDVPKGIQGPAFDVLTLDVIAAMLNGTEWSPDTVAAIATLVRATGRHVGDVSDVDEATAQAAARLVDDPLAALRDKLAVALRDKKLAVALRDQLAAEPPPPPPLFRSTLGDMPTPKLEWLRQRHQAVLDRDPHNTFSKRARDNCDRELQRRQAEGGAS